MRNFCEEIIRIEELKSKVMLSRMNPPYILERGKPLSEAKPLYKAGYIDEDTQASIDRMNEYIRKTVAMMARAVGIKPEELYEQGN